MTKGTIMIAFETGRTIPLSNTALVVGYEDPHERIATSAGTAADRIRPGAKRQTIAAQQMGATSLGPDTLLTVALGWKQKGHPRIAAEKANIKVTQIGAESALAGGEQRRPAGAVAIETMDEGEMQTPLVIAEIVGEA